MSKGRSHIERVCGDKDVGVVDYNSLSLQIDVLLAKRMNSMKSLLRITMKCLPLLFLTFITTISGIQELNGKETEVKRKPKNFVFFLVDDLGWADVGCFGSKFHETPNIDALAQSGMRFTNAYAACPVCSPTRASILTGRHPVRVGITDWIPGMSANRVADAKFAQVEDRDSLALEEVTIAEVLKKQGYATFFAGKWHLGDRGHWPTDQGFDINIGGNKKGSPPGGYYAPWKNPTLKSNNAGEYLTERLTQESIRFLEKTSAANDSAKSKSEKPFLLFLSYYNVHSPITPFKKRIDHFKAKREATFKSAPAFVDERNGYSRTTQDNAAYASMVSAVDESVGAILERLEQLKLSDDTAVIFFSDNGGLCTLPRKNGPTSNLPLRSGKGWLYEGGIREPMIVRVPGVTSPESVCSQPVISMDFFPTMMELAGLQLDPTLHVDGQSLLPVLSENRKLKSRDLYWHYPHYHGSAWKPGAAILSGDWKLIEFYEEDKAELYNLRNDPSESTDLAARFPDQQQQLRKKLRSWQKSMHAKMPIPR